MSFDASPEKHTDLMCFDEPMNLHISMKNDVNLLDIDSKTPSVATEQLPVDANHPSDLNRMLEQAKSSLEQTEADLRKKDRELVQVLSLTVILICILY